jgi:hypothetical protein
MVIAFRRSGEVVTQRSAKPRCAGSIPAYASDPDIAYWVRPGGGIGIRARLKIVSRKGCGFDAHPGHKKINNFVYKII